MLDFTRLKTPSTDGQVLILPDAKGLAAAVSHNTALFQQTQVEVLGVPLGEWRRRTREKLLGGDDRPVIAVGHQPGFIHPGVWAKQVVARRLADALGGLGINLVVDNDAPQSVSLAVPVVNGDRLEMHSVRLFDLPSGFAYEQLESWNRGRIVELGREMESQWGERFSRSLMPEFLKALAQSAGSTDPIETFLAARRALDSPLGAAVDDLRVSRAWWTPMLQDMLAGADRFAVSYDRALAWYRQEFRVRGGQRPIPDLQRRGSAWELPVWAYRRGEARRRVFVVRRGDAAELTTAEEPIATVSLKDATQVDELTSPLGGPAQWRLRPRALALTIWARLFLADVFIHGIGGAKYDRISDAIIRDYYGLEPPHMGCVSATLHPELPHRATGGETIRALECSLRDLHWNPQRHLDRTPQREGLLTERAAAMQQAQFIQSGERSDRSVRRKVFERIRELNRGLLATAPEALPERLAELDRTRNELAQTRIAQGREYFYALYPRSALERLLQALPAADDFRI